MGQALPPGAVLMTLERDKRVADVARRHLAGVGLHADQVAVHHGNAIDLYVSVVL